MRNINYKQDWNKICATYDTFENLAISPAWFGNTGEEAKKDLIKQSPETLTIRLEEKQSDDLFKVKTALRKATYTRTIKELITNYIINNNL